MVRIAALLSLAAALLVGNASFAQASVPAVASHHIAWAQWHSGLLSANRADPPPPPAPVAAKPAPTAITNWLRSEDGRISVYVGIYDDPSGSTPVPHGYAVLDLAMTWVRWYFDGHNPGVFTPLQSEGTGSVLDYWDGSGKLHRLQLISVRSWQRDAGEPGPASGAVVAQFQTCRTLDGSVDWIYDAVEI